MCLGYMATFSIVPLQIMAQFSLLFIVCKKMNEYTDITEFPLT